MLAPGSALCAVVEMIGSIPNIGFSYMAEDGTTPVFSLNVSGMDGSLFLDPVELVNK